MTMKAVLPGQGKPFRTAAEGFRGVTAWFEREGGLTSGGIVRIHVSEMRA